jgi:hypothetical protein
MKEPKALKRILPIDIQEMKKEVRVTPHGGLWTIGEMFRAIRPAPSRRRMMF